MQRRPAQFKIEWDTHEYEHKKRSAEWFWAVGIITFSIIIASIIFGNIIFAILVLISVLSLALFINRTPENIHVVVNERGVSRGKIHYPYESLSSYWLDTEHPHPKIILCSDKPFIPLIVVPIGPDADPEKLDETLAEFLPERYHALPFVERLLEYIGF